MIVNKFKSGNQIYDVAVNVENITNVQNLKQSDLGKQIYSLINNSTPEDITNLVHFSKSRSREYALADTTSGTIYFPYDGIYPIFMGIEWGKNDYSLDEEQIRILSIVRSHITGEEVLFDDDERVLFDDGQLVEFDTNDNWITKEELNYLLDSFIRKLTEQIDNNIELLNNIDKKFDKYYSKTYINNNYYTKKQIDDLNNNLNNSLNTLHNDLNNTLNDKVSYSSAYQIFATDSRATGIETSITNTTNKLNSICKAENVYKTFINSAFSNNVFINSNNIIDIYRSPNRDTFVSSDGYYCYSTKLKKRSDSVVYTSYPDDGEMIYYMISDDIPITLNHWYRFTNQVLGILVKSGNDWKLIDKTVLPNDVESDNFNPFKNITPIDGKFSNRTGKRDALVDISHIYKDSNYSRTIFKTYSNSILSKEYLFSDFINDNDELSIRIVISSSINFDDIKMIDLGTENYDNNFSINDVFTYDSIIRHLSGEINTIVNSIYPISYNNSFTEEGIYLTDTNISNVIEVIPNDINNNFVLKAVTGTMPYLADTNIEQIDNTLTHTFTLSKPMLSYAVRYSIVRYIIKNKYNDITLMKKYGIVQPAFYSYEDLDHIDIDNIYLLQNSYVLKHDQVIPTGYIYINGLDIMYIKSDVLSNYNITFKSVTIDMGNDTYFNSSKYNIDDYEDNNIPVDYTISTIDVTLHDNSIITYTKIKVNNADTTIHNHTINAIFILFVNNQN